MITISKVMLDIDGVCGRLIMHALEVNACGVTQFDDDKWPNPGSYDIVRAANELRGPRGLPPVSTSEFWNAVPRRIWGTSALTAEAGELIRWAEWAVGRTSVCMLTSPTIDPDCLAGKLEWIHSRLPSWLRRQYLIGPRKHFCAHPATLLIDDSDHNVDEFRQHGGQAVLVPRPWNSRHAESPRMVFSNLEEIHRAALQPSEGTAA
jgi:hypothetical protein